MVEDLRTWNLLTASLAVCDLNDPQRAWAFLVVQGLVRDRPGDRDAFNAILARELALGEIAGPTAARRVAAGLAGAGLVLPRGRTADPMGDTAARRWELITSWFGSGKSKA